MRIRWLLSCALGALLGWIAGYIGCGQSRMAGNLQFSNKAWEGMTVTSWDVARKDYYLCAPIGTDIPIDFVEAPCGPLKREIQTSKCYVGDVAVVYRVNGQCEPWETRAANRHEASRE